MYKRATSDDTTCIYYCFYRNIPELCTTGPLHCSATCSAQKVPTLNVHMSGWRVFSWNVWLHTKPHRFVVTLGSYVFGDHAVLHVEERSLWGHLWHRGSSNTLTTCRLKWCNIHSSSMHIECSKLSLKHLTPAAAPNVLGTSSCSAWQACNAQYLSSWLVNQITHYMPFIHLLVIPANEIHYIGTAIPLT